MDWNPGVSRVPIPTICGRVWFDRTPTLGEVFLVLRGLEFRRNHLFSSYSNQVGRALAHTLTRFHAHWAPLLEFPCFYLHECKLDRTRLG